MAEKDPGAAKTNQLARSRTAEFYVGLVTTMETVLTLDKRPLSPTCAASCDYLVRQDNLRVLADAPFGMLAEFETDAEITEIPSLPDDWRLQLGSALRQASIGTLPRTVVEGALRDHTTGVASTQKTVEEVLGGKFGNLYRKHAEFSDLMADPECEGYAFAIAKYEAAKMGLAPPNGRVAFVADLALAVPRLKPTLAGVIRANLFTGWHAAHHGQMPFQNDLKTILPALRFDVVLTADRGLEKRGRRIFPELPWGRPNSWEPGDLAEWMLERLKKHEEPEPWGSKAPSQ